MAGKRARKRLVPKKKELVHQTPSLDLPDSEAVDVVRSRLRQRWELASVLNFIRVFKPVIEAKLDISAEEIETAIITPNALLSQLHISLLKGIPPVSKNLTGSDAWVTVLCKKLASWWPWVAESEIPLKASNGEETSKYKELHPINRLLILKALCEIRAFQPDAVSYINNALKEGTDLCTFRKDRTGGDGTGVAYWSDGDAVIGYRLYREVTNVQMTPRKGKGRLAQPTNSRQWETLATNLDEFQQISDKLSSSEIVDEAAVGEVIKNEIIPVLDGIQKKKERALKRQEKQEKLLNGYLNSYRLENARSCRSRKPVNYTFAEYDRCIDEALQLNKRLKTTQESQQEQKAAKKGNLTRDVAGLRRSKRITGHADLETRNHAEVPRHSSSNSDNGSVTVSDSDDGSSPKSSATKTSDDEESSLDVLEGLLDE
ncbi:hypothetical protein IFM89_004262 [Coptis chinensis]|uniref:DDT domain-containing protein DDR4 n=1 Tax=Coptis chinensis TaxID=261450 RepID=A0A835IAN5_9MAGN|nr:hypothetical protein IFM89_004262 [Coptis chinensis]